MRINRTTTQLKQLAKMRLRGNYKNAILLMVASNLIISCLTLVFGGSSTTSIASMVMDYLINFILTILSAVFMVGQCSFYLKLSCGQPVSFQDLFEGFKVYPEKTVISQLLLQILLSIPLIPGFILAWEIAGSIDPTFQTLPTYNATTFWLTIAGYVIYIWLTLMFSQTRYILLDFPDLSAMDLLKKSRQLMKGNKGRLFLLDLSFLPLSLLSILSFGIGFLFLLPYMYMTHTLFYLDLVSCEDEEF